MLVVDAGIAELLHSLARSRTAVELASDLHVNEIALEVLQAGRALDLLQAGPALVRLDLSGVRTQGRGVVFGALVHGREELDADPVRTSTTEISPCCAYDVLRRVLQNIYLPTPSLGHVLGCVGDFGRLGLGLLHPDLDVLLVEEHVVVIIVAILQIVVFEASPSWPMPCADWALVQCLLLRQGQALLLRRASDHEVGRLVRS
mmetsp:Transcript_81463/g.209755  ORF Transcript_81463/g.209755 Transcript_81463/m.209755 type:complete len:203 (+) Transcript_81463:617-1225(+)